mmetsp:Transcript_35034/g.73906  ORF Transcript_35034/g.73906 Transcript_35034/m.73906 type:complete len:605 (-) Transcript_35034:53-1867(-)
MPTPMIANTNANNSPSHPRTMISDGTRGRVNGPDDTGTTYDSTNNGDDNDNDNDDGDDVNRYEEGDSDYDGSDDSECEEYNEAYAGASDDWDPTADGAEIVPPATTDTTEIVADRSGRSSPLSPRTRSIGDDDNDTPSAVATTSPRYVAGGEPPFAPRPAALPDNAVIGAGDCNAVMAQIMLFQQMMMKRLDDIDSKLDTKADKGDLDALGSRLPRRLENSNGPIPKADGTRASGESVRGAPKKDVDLRPGAIPKELTTSVAASNKTIAEFKSNAKEDAETSQRGTTDEVGGSPEKLRDEAIAFEGSRIFSSGVGDDILHGFVARTTPPPASTPHSPPTVSVPPTDVMPDPPQRKAPEATNPLASTPPPTDSSIGRRPTSHRRRDTSVPHPRDSSGPGALPNDTPAEDGITGASKLEVRKVHNRVENPRRKLKRKKLPCSVPDPPPPKGNKSEYGIGEFLGIMKHVPPNKRRKMVLKMQSTQFGYVPVTERTVYRIFKESSDGVHFEFDQEWRRNGHPPRIENSRLEICARKLAECQGRKEVQEKINDIILEEEERKGLVAEEGKIVNRTTVNAYMAIFASMDNDLTIVDTSAAQLGPNNHTLL